MKTAEDVISAIKEMPIEEQRKVVEFLNFEMEEAYQEENYSPEDMAEIDRRDEEAKKGVNIERFSSMSEARKSLGLT